MPAIKRVDAKNWPEIFQYLSNGDIIKNPEPVIFVNLELGRCTEKWGDSEYLKWFGVIFCFRIFYFIWFKSMKL